MTYYGALDCVSGEVILSRYKTANSLSTIDFIKHLQRRSEGAQIVLYQVRIISYNKTGIVAG
uniref:Uncharacterized protein n=1 Tax=Moorena producens (strain JHB) TaxID=1454205 RepID=A0A1D9FY22_MOOP1